jgi:hypothetical protein
MSKECACVTRHRNPGRLCPLQYQQLILQGTKTLRLRDNGRMAAKRSEPWRIDLADVAVDRSWLRTGGRSGSATRSSRAEGLQTGTMRLTHRPTGISLEGTVPEGHYSRGQMTAEMDAVKATLLRELEQRVAAHFRLPGR